MSAFQSNNRVQFPARVNANGPSRPRPTDPILSALQQSIPFLTAPFISTTRNTRCGRGMIVPVTVAANTDITVNHNMGRLVQGMIPIINHGGATLTPKLKFGAGPRDFNRQSINADTTLTNCLIWFV